MKINVKGYLMQLLTGIEFKDLAPIFSFKERINIIQTKLLMEGFDI